jgi:hypothetical protein
LTLRPNSPSKILALPTPKVTFAEFYSDPLHPDETVFIRPIAVITAGRRVLQVM